MDAPGIRRRECSDPSPEGKLARAELLIFLVLFATGASAQQAHVPDPVSSPEKLVRETIHNEIQARSSDSPDGSRWCYERLQQINGAKMLSSVCQTDQGNFYQTVAIDDRRLDAEHQRSEDERIRGLLENRQKISTDRKKQDRNDQQFAKLIALFPDAFIFRYQGQQGKLIQLSFAPNPKFQPTDRAALVIHHLGGTLLIDCTQNRVVEMHGVLLSDVKFGGGLLGHLAEGGTFSLRQQEIRSGHWEIAFMDLQFDGTALFFKTIDLKRRENRTNFRPAPHGLTFQKAAAFLSEEISARAAAN